MPLLSKKRGVIRVGTGNALRMPDDDLKTQLAQITANLEVLIQTISSLVDIAEITKDAVQELLKWAQTPPSRDLHDVLASLVTVVDGLQDMIITVGRRQDEIAAALCGERT